MRHVLLVTPKFSICLCTLFSVLYVLSFIVCALAQIPLLLHFGIAIFLMINFISVLRRFVFYRHPLSVKRLWRDSDGLWKLQCCDTHVRTARLIQSALISRHLVLLSFKIPGRFLSFSLPLAYDSESVEVMRSLRYTLMSEPSVVTH